MDLDLLLPQLVDLLLLVGQQLLQFLPLRLQVRVPALQELVLVLVLKPALLLLIHLPLPLLQLAQRLLRHRRPHAAALLPPLHARQLLHHALVVLPQRGDLLAERLDVLSQRLLLRLPLQLPGRPLLLLGLFLLAPLLLLETVLPAPRRLEVFLALEVDVPLLPVPVRFPEAGLN